MMMKYCKIIDTHTKIVLFGCLLAILTVSQVIHNQHQKQEKEALRRSQMYVYLEDEPI
jgi:hypothetical protein